MQKGTLYIISAPSGAGKTSLIKSVKSKLPDLLVSVSYTTRQIRRKEVPGKDYNFITEAEFKKGIDRGRWLEWALVYGNYYGTSAGLIIRSLAAGRKILLEIDVQGAVQIMDKYPRANTIFIMPPSLEILKERLAKRGSDSLESITKRLQNVENEIRQNHLYRHLIINDHFETAAEQLLKILKPISKSSGEKLSLRVVSRQRNK